MDRPKLTRRDRGGRYDFDGRWDRLCVCGYTLGEHAAEPPRPCFSADPETGHPSDACGCERFRLSRKKPNKMKTASRIISYNGALYFTNDVTEGKSQVVAIESLSPLLVSHKLNVMIKKTIEGNEDVDIEDALQEACDLVYDFSEADMDAKEHFEFGFSLGKRAGNKKVWITTIMDNLSLLWIGSENEVSERIWEAAHKANEANKGKVK